MEAWDYAERFHSHRGFSPVIKPWANVLEPFPTVSRNLFPPKTVEMVRAGAALVLLTFGSDRSIAIPKQNNQRRYQQSEIP
jgi:hypothetical protein